MSFGKLPRYSIEARCSGIIGYTDGSWRPDPNEHLIKAFFTNPDNAIAVGGCMAMFQPGCAAVQVFDNGKIIYTFEGANITPGISVPGSLIVPGGNKEPLNIKLI